MGRSFWTLARCRGTCYLPVFRIHDILGWIRIRILGSVVLTNGSGSGSCKKLIFNTIFSAYYFLKVHLHHFSKIKSQKILEAQKHVDPVDPDPAPDPEHCYLQYRGQNGKQLYPERSHECTRVPGHAFLAWRSSWRCLCTFSNRSDPDQVHRVHIPAHSGVHSIMMEKSAQAAEEGSAIHTHPLSLYLPSRTKLWRTLQLRGQVIFVLCGRIPCYSHYIVDNNKMVHSCNCLCHTRRPCFSVLQFT